MTSSLPTDFRSLILGLSSTRHNAGSEGQRSPGPWRSVITQRDRCALRAKSSAVKVLSERGRVSVVQEANWLALRVVGEHDLSTATLFDAAFAEIMLIGTVDVRVDLSDVTFMDCSTVRMMVHGRSLLASRHQVLTIRGVTARQRWFLDLCGLSDLISDSSDGTAEHAQRGVTPLESWVDVPATARAVAGPTPPVESSSVSNSSKATRE